MTNHSEIISDFNDWWSPPLSDFIVIMGGGRWGITWSSVASKILGPDHTVFIVSNHLRKSIQCDGAARIRAVSNLNDISVNGNIKPVIIASRPDNHIKDALQVFEWGGIPLIEKPLSTNLQETRFLLEKYQSESRMLAAANVFLFAPYLHEVRELINQNLTTPLWFLLEWSDPANEKRHGGYKNLDISTPVSFDIWPHIDSITKIVFGKRAAPMGVSVSKGGLHLQITCKVGNVNGDVLLRRAGESRLRRLTIGGNDGEFLINFTTEPGYVISGSMNIELKELWKQYPSPLQLELGCFLTGLHRGHFSHLLSPHESLPSLESAKFIQNKVINEQAKIIKNSLKLNLKPDENILFAISTNFHNYIEQQGISLRDEKSVFYKAKDIYKKLLYENIQMPSGLMKSESDFIKKLVI